MYKTIQLNAINYNEPDNRAARFAVVSMLSAVSSAWTTEPLWRWNSWSKDKEKDRRQDRRRPSLPVRNEASERRRRRRRIRRRRRRKKRRLWDAAGSQDRVTTWNTLVLLVVRNSSSSSSSNRPGTRRRKRNWRWSLRWSVYNKMTDFFFWNYFLLKLFFFIFFFVIFIYLNVNILCRVALPMLMINEDVCEKVLP